MHFLTLAVLDEPVLPLSTYKCKSSFYLDLYQSVSSVVDQYMSFHEHECSKYDSELDAFDVDASCDSCDQVIGDGYIVGGRWTGLLTGYNPNSDPDNLMFCRGCRGLGFTYTLSADSCQIKKCNLCVNPASLDNSLLWPLWPSDFNIYPGDITTIGKYKELLCQDQEPPSHRDNLIPAYLISSDLTFDSNAYTWNGVQEEFQDCLSHFAPEDMVVVLDVHY